MLLLVFFSFFSSNTYSIDDVSFTRNSSIIGHFILVFIIFYIGLRPISGKYFGDMGSYAFQYEDFVAGEKVDFINSKDLGFDIYMKLCSEIMSVEFFFLMCAILYVVPLYLAVKKILNKYWFYPFFFLVISFSFWSYGTNGLRNGIATSLFIYAITRDDKKKIITFLIIASLFHKSIYIPLLAYIISLLYKNTKTYIIIWLLAIPLSLALGSFWEGFFANLNLFDSDRFEGYLDGDEEFQEQFSSLGFRWDFLVYSATGVLSGWYFIIKKGFNDKYYTIFFNIYLITNSFWILIIRANFSNRFAYLSWFLLGLVISYPFAKEKFFNSQHRNLGIILLAYFAFTFLMNVILA